MIITLLIRAGITALDLISEHKNWSKNLSLGDFVHGMVLIYLQALLLG